MERQKSPQRPLCLRPGSPHLVLLSKPIILFPSRSEPETFGPTPACRNNHTTAVHEDRIYFHGGHDGNQWLDDLYILNTSSLVWNKPKISGQVLKLFYLDYSLETLC